MPDSITASVREVKTAARRLAIVRGVVQVLAIALVSACALALLDYLLRFEDLGSRLLWSTLWLVAIGVSAWFWLLPITRSGWSDEAVAKMIERRFPNLREKLSSSLAFLSTSESDALLSSQSLMRNVIAQTTTALTGVNLKDAIDPRPTWKAGGWLAGAVAVCGMFCFANPAASSQAVSRLMAPWNSNVWPRVNHLRFVDPPTRVAEGGDLRLELIDENGRLPSQVSIRLWYEGQKQHEAQVVLMQRIDDKMVLQRNNVSRGFQYRATGGDDQQMSWSELKVVDPPRVTAGNTTLTPPGYTGWLSYSTDEPLGAIRVLEGTKVQLSGSADRPLSAVALSVHGAESKQTYSADVNGTNYSVPSSGEAWSLDDAATYSLSLSDKEGTTTVAPDQWPARIVRDEPPQLSLLEPDAEELVTPNAVLPIRCKVEDDLAIRRVELRYLRTDQSDQGELAEQLYAGPDQLVKVAAPDVLPPKSEVREVVYPWSLEPLRLPRGVALSFHLFGEDYKGQESRTLARRLVVVSESDLLDRVGRRQSLVLSRLKKRLEQQRLAKTQVDSVKLQLEEAKQFDKATMDRLQTGLLAQRQVNSALRSEDGEVVEELKRLKSLLDRSRVGKVDVRTRIEKTLSSVNQIAAQHLDPALRAATSAQQAMQAARDQNQQDRVPDEVPTKLDQASQHQQAAAGALEDLLDEMSKWDSYRRFAQDVSDLLRQQAEIKDATREVAKETLTRRLDQLDGQQRAALKSAAARQADLARRMDRTLSNLGKVEQELQQSDPQSAQMVRDAMQAARDGVVAGAMRQAGRQIEKNKLGLATQQQEAAEKALEEMLDQLSRRSLSPEQREEKLGETDRALQKLQKEQAELSRDFEKANQQQNAERRKRELKRLAKQQQQVAQQTRKLERQLQRLRSNDSSQRTGQAAKTMEAAAQSAQQESSPSGSQGGQQGKQAGQQQGEQSESQQAEQLSKLAEAQLQQAREELQQEQEQAKTELAQEQMIRLPQLIDALIGQQRGVNEEIVRLDTLRTEQGELTPGQQTSLEMTAESQRAVAQDAGLVAGQMSQLPAFEYALKEIQLSMNEVAEALQDLDTSNETHVLADKVLAELTMIREMLKNDPAKQSPGGGGQGQGGEQQQGGQQGENIDARMAQLKLLRNMQVDVNKQTKQMDTMSAADGTAQRVLDTRMRRLSDRQGSLVSLLRKLIQTRPQPAVQLPKPEEQPEPDERLKPNRQAAPDLDALDRELDDLLK